ncbi:MAG: hypothetical protein KKE73_16685 [Proteobacteria bacterium]|nr:hypothetical protein [Pseudomonadota bacterium]
MDLIQPPTSGFWKKTAPATLRRGLIISIDHILRTIQAPGQRRNPTACALTTSQLQRALRLATAEIVESAKRSTEFFLPAKARFPVALLAYLLLVFALEVVFLKTFLPDQSPLQPKRAGIALWANWDPDELADARDIVLAALPTSFGTHLSLQRITGSVTAPFSDPDSLSLLGQAAFDLQDEFSHPLLALALCPRSDEPSVPFDSVRFSVNRSSQRMPVDPQAVHPLDREAFQATATRKTRLSSLFSRLESPKTKKGTLAALPSSAIAPPMSRLDKIRTAESRRAKLGDLCALFESGVRGIFAIGYDVTGGTSYGKYQISSRKGAMHNFIAYIDKRAPAWAQRLKIAGQSNTGGTLGAMPRAWRQIASEHPKLFEKLQDDFIHNYYYSPTLNEVKLRTGLDLNTHPPVLREVLWSTAVQHGPSGGASIFIKADGLAKAHLGKDYVVTLLKEVFREREKRLSKTPLQTQSVLRARLKHEMALALNRLGYPQAQRATLVSSATDLLM